MGIKTVRLPPYSPDLAPCDFWLFPKLSGCRYETIEEMKETVTKVIDTLTQEDFHGAFQKLLERYNKCIAAGGDYFDGDKSFMCVLSIKVPIRKKSGNLFNDPCIWSIILEGLPRSYRVMFRCIFLCCLFLGLFFFCCCELSYRIRLIFKQNYSTMDRTQTGSTLRVRVDLKIVLFPRKRASQSHTVPCSNDLLLWVLIAARNTVNIF